jgi:branched-subunit amino acid ABC-type transport system permease component
VAVGTSNLVSRAGTGPLNPLPVLAALGVAVVIEQVVSQLWPAGLQFPDLLGQRIFNVGPYELTPLHAAGLIAGLIAIATSAAVLGRIRGERARMLGLALAGLIAGVSGCLAAQAGFGPGYMVVPALVAALAAAIARFRRLELAFLAAIAIELARTFSVRYDLPHAGYTAGVALVLIGALALYGAYYLAGSVRGAGGRIRL